MGESPLNPASIPIATLCEMLTRIGGKEVTPTEIQSLIARGLPVRADGTIDLVTYTAWLTQVYLSD